MPTTQPSTDQPVNRRYRQQPADPTLLRKCDAALVLGVTRSRISQLIKAGHLQPRPDGLITVAEVDRCRRCEPIGWQPDFIKASYSGPRGPRTR